MILTYLSLKLILLPILGASVQIPELSFPDIILMCIIFLFQPQSSKIFESLDFSPQGVKAKFRKLEDEVNEAKEDLYELQQKQINEINELQQFMYQLLLNETEVDKLKDIKRHTDDGTPYNFEVTSSAARELRRLRASKLITVKCRIRDLEIAGNFGKKSIDLIYLNPENKEKDYKVCQLTQKGKDFLEKLDKITNET